MRSLDSASDNLCYVAFPTAQVLPFLRTPLPPQFPIQQQVVCALLTESEFQSSTGPQWSLSRGNDYRVAFQDMDDPIKPSTKCIKLSRISALVDFQQIRNWITFCETNHKGPPCRLPQRHFNVQADERRKNSLSGFRLIDTTIDSIVPSALSVKYVALSYVWGKKAQQTAEWPLPKLLQDAVAVTKSLGFRYLWVDRYCIPETDKHNQISRMDLIYREAQVTIIAACGDDVEHGMPGVSVYRTSTELPEPPLGLALMPDIDVRNAVRQSKWWTRGWTYQEGLLSRRRLVFTNHEVYYECNGMFCYEGVDLNLASLHEMGGLWFRDFLIPGLLDGRQHFNPIHWRNIRGSMHSSGKTRFAHLLLLKQLISHYSGRVLTYNSDRLDAFRGILISHDFFTYYGLPVVISKGYGISDLEVKHQQRRIIVSMHDFNSILCGWSHARAGPSPDHHLSAPVSSQRIDRFPSWSWAGWTGMVDFESWEDFYHGLMGSPGFNSPAHHYGRIILKMILKEDGIERDFFSGPFAITKRLLIPGDLTEEPPESLDLSTSLSRFIEVSGHPISWPELPELALLRRDGRVDIELMPKDRVPGMFGNWTISFHLSVPGNAEALLQELQSGNIHVIYHSAFFDTSKRLGRVLCLVLRQKSRKIEAETTYPLSWERQPEKRPGAVWERLGLCHLERKAISRGFYISKELDFVGFEPLTFLPKHQYFVG